MRRPDNLPTSLWTASALVSSVAEQSDDLTLADLERDLIDRSQVAVGSGQSFYMDHQITPFCDYLNCPSRGLNAWCDHGIAEKFSDNREDSVTARRHSKYSVLPEWDNSLRPGLGRSDNINAMQ
jgi:hypothetical protein